MVGTPSDIPSLFVAGEELSTSILLQNIGNVKLTNLRVRASKDNDKLGITWPELDAGGLAAVTVSTYTELMSQAFIDILKWSNTAVVEVRGHTRSYSL